MNSMNVKRLVLTALFAALICVTTWIVHIPIPMGVQGAYVHIGDVFIYLAASMLPLPYAMLASAIGGGLADFLSGAVVYVLPTVIIKPIMAACFTNQNASILNKRNVAAVFLAGFVCIAGYYIAEVIMLKDFRAPLVNIPFGLIQPIASGIIYVIAAKVIGQKNIFKV